MQNLVEFIHLKKFLVIHEKSIQKMRYIEKNICIFSNILEKISSKSPFYEKVKMTTKRTIILESFVIVDSFDCDCTHYKAIVIGGL
jgi:hypothetical protein